MFYVLWLLNVSLVTNKSLDVFKSITQHVILTLRIFNALMNQNGGLDPDYISHCKVYSRCNFICDSQEHDKIR